MFTIRRLLASVLILLASSVITFALAASVADPLAPLRQRRPPPTPEEMAAQAHLLGLDRPLHVRYLEWLSHAIRGDFGTDLGGNSVNQELAEHLGLTVRLLVAAMVVAVILAIVVGVLSAVRQNKLSDYVSTTIAYILIAMPTFWFATLLKQFVAIPINNTFFGGEPIIGVFGPWNPLVKLTGSPSEFFWNQVGYSVLPVMSLAALSYAGWSRFQRATTLDVLNSDYVRLARAKGLRYPRVLFRHVLRNALIPTTTVVALGVGLLIGGAVVTETVFGWSGMGSWLLDALHRGDPNILLCWLIVSASAVVVFNLIADLLYAVLDPRIRLH